MWIRCFPLIAITLVSALARGEVERVEIASREVVLDGRAFGDAGAYERLSGTVFFAWDPTHAANEAVVDLDLAPRDEDGLVRASANFMVLQAVDPEKRSGVGLFEVSNRGGKASMSYFNRARGSSTPATEDHFGDGLLMRQGLTVIWVGWQWDVPGGPDRLRLMAPVAPKAEPGLVRSDWVVNEPVGELGLGHRGHTAYMPAAVEDPRNVLTVRDARTGTRRILDRATWRFTDLTDAAVGQPKIFLDGGFESGHIYELVYVAREPRVSGAGLAAIRDIVSYAKHDDKCEFGVDQGIAFGVSQTGRFLRMFLYQGFNTDEHDRKAYDGMLIHTAGAGRGSFNHRYAQASRDAHRYSAFFYPTDIFPFTSRPQLDEQTSRREGLMDRTPAGFAPKVFFTNTGYEYWGRAAALIHVSPDGARDTEPLDTERIYHLAGGQHFVHRGRARPLEGPAQLGNPVDFIVTERALLVRLIAWVRDGTKPPLSQYPRLDNATLVPIDAWRFPEIPELTHPTLAHEAYRADYGTRWDQGIIDVQPPKLGRTFPVLVPQVDALGNEIAGVRPLELRVPTATYTPWSLRIGLPGPEHELRDFVGMTIPLAKSKDEQDNAGDPRASIEALYADRSEYEDRVRRAARTLVQEGFMLEEDLERAIAQALVR